MWLAIFADVGVMILAVLNAIITLFIKKLASRERTASVTPSSWLLEETTTSAMDLKAGTAFPIAKRSPDAETW